MNLQERSDKRSLALHRAVVKRLGEKPELWAIPLQNIERWTDKDGGIPMPFKIWKDILETTPREKILTLLLSRSQRATQLRSSSPFTGIISKKQRNLIFDTYNKIYRKGLIMETKQFTIAELEDMLENQPTLHKNLLDIAKKFREIQPNFPEIDYMINGYIECWGENSYGKYKGGASDHSAMFANQLVHQEFDITRRLITLLKIKQPLDELKTAVREYLKHPSTDGAPIRQEQRRNLAELVKEQNHE